MQNVDDMTIANYLFDDVTTHSNDSDNQDVMIDDTTLDDTSNDDVIPNANDTTFVTKHNFVKFLHEMDDVIDSKEIDRVSF